MKILVYGAGVIGSLYAVLMSNAGYRVTVFARGKRLADLRENGLRYRDGEAVKRANVRIIEKLDRGDIYDYILLPVRSEQLAQALRELKDNGSPNIVTMVNTLERYEQLETLCGRGRLIPAFPGAGGSIEDGILRAGLTPALIQPTTLGEIGGKSSERLKALAGIWKQSRIPYRIVPDMHAWQVSHLGLVVPIADAYYMSENPETVHMDRSIMTETAKRMKANFRLLAQNRMLSPFKLQLLMRFPVFAFSRCLAMVFQSDFGHTFMYEHAMNAPQEMRRLHDDFYGYVSQL